MQNIKSIELGCVMRDLEMGKSYSADENKSERERITVPAYFEYSSRSTKKEIE